ncbi:MAG: hypothetical protein Kow0089_05230 [Desulfobulbaceae bacterium]
MTGAKAASTISRAARRICLALVLLLLLDGAFFLFSPLDLLYPFRFPPPSGQFQVAAVLFNDFNGTYDGINDETKRRIHRAMSLLERNIVDRLVVVGGNREGSERHGAQLMADYLLAQGVPADKITVADTSRDSLSNLEELERIAHAERIETIGLVSSPYHLRRIQTMRLPLRTGLRYVPWDPFSCTPPLTRSEVWFSAHYNMAAYLAQQLLPSELYRGVVYWIREHTEW